PCTIEPLGRPVAVNGLKFFVKAGSPEPATTRHLCAAGAAARSTAAGVAAATTVATMAHAATAETATQRVVRRGGRIGLSCLSRPRSGRLQTECPKAFPEALPRFYIESQALLFANCGKMTASEFRNVPENGSIARWDRRHRLG